MRRYKRSPDGPTPAASPPNSVNIFYNAVRSRTFLFSQKTTQTSVQQHTPTKIDTVRTAKIPRNVRTRSFSGQPIPQQEDSDRTNPVLSRTFLYVPNWTRLFSFLPLFLSIAYTPFEPCTFPGLTHGSAELSLRSQLSAPIPAAFPHSD